MSDQYLSQMEQKNVPGVAPPVWTRIRAEAEIAANEEPIMASYLNAVILSHNRFCDALSYHLAQIMANADMSALQMLEIFHSAYAQGADLVTAAERDIQAVIDRDPACSSALQPFLYFKGYQALQSYRIAHWLWRSGRQILAYHFQSRISQRFDVDIHPAAIIGSGVMIDHATGVVIGETAIVGDDCSLLHSVTLGGTGKDAGDRHPKIGRGVLISAGAKVLGNIHIGDNARIAAGSVVLQDVHPTCTVAGVPAKYIACDTCDPAQNMDQLIDANGK